jgi:hypothetical protein
MRWQASHHSLFEFKLVDGDVYIDEAFQLLACAATAQELIDRLAQQEE